MYGQIVATKRKYKKAGLGSMKKLNISKKRRSSANYISAKYSEICVCILLAF